MNAARVAFLKDWKIDIARISSRHSFSTGLNAVFLVEYRHPRIPHRGSEKTVLMCQTIILH